MRTMLVTGATGFVGPVVCRYLQSGGWSVRAVARRPPECGQLPTAVDFVEADLTGEVDYDRLLIGIDTVIHLAARVHVMRDRSSDPLADYRRANAAATRRLARAASERGVRRIVFLSTIKVNGDHTEANAFSAQDAPNPQDPYGISKWEAEQALHEVAATSGLEVVIIRPPLVYGPRVGANFMRMIRLVECGFPLPLASIDNRRSVVFVENLADAIVACLFPPVAVGKTYLVSDGAPLSTPELLRLVARAMRRAARLWRFPPALLSLVAHIVGRRGDATRLIGSLVVDGSLICRELGWSPPFPTSKGIERTVNWYFMTQASPHENIGRI